MSHHTTGHSMAKAGRALIRPQEVVHLPVAPQVTARTRFSSSVPRRVNFLMPHEALELLDSIVVQRSGGVRMAAITGPGDPLAVPDTTVRTVELVRQHYPDLRIGLRTLGIGGERFASELARAGVDHVELQVDAVRTETLKKLYAWIRPGLKTLKIGDAVELLLREQRNCVPALKYDGIGVSISTTLYPGYNLDQVKQISSLMMELGADSISLLPYKPEAGAEVLLEPPNSSEMEQAVQAAASCLPVLESLFCQPAPDETADPDIGGSSLPKPTPARPNVAVVSSSGMEIDLHLGQAAQILIYGPREDGLTCLLETRQAPEAGGGERRWQDLALRLSDCFALCAAGVGESPRRILGDAGLRVLIVEEAIAGCVDTLYGGGKSGKKKR